MQLTEKIEKTIATKIRPILNSHGGDIELVEVNGKDVRVRLMGACSSCPLAQKTMEDIVETAFRQELGSDVGKISLWNSVSQELIDLARNILKK
jgi:Fe-S cluster biogenesis protein NfuA